MVSNMPRNCCRCHPSWADITPRYGPGAQGVSWHKHSQKWYAYIQAGGRMRGLGYFGTQLAAAHAHDAEARRARLPPGGPGMHRQCLCDS